MADQSERHPSTKSSDTVSHHKLENIDPGVDGPEADEEAEFVKDMGLADTLNSATMADVATPLKSTDLIDSNIGFNTNSAEDESLSAVDGGEPVQRDDGNDLLATSNYPEGTTHPGPEDSADLFDSLAKDETTNTQVSDTRPSSEDEGALVSGEEIDNQFESDQSSTDFEQTLSVDEVDSTLVYNGENLESSDSELAEPAELTDPSTSTIQDSFDDLEDASVDSNQGAESDYVYNVPGQYASGETMQEIPAVDSETSIDIGDRSVQSDASNTGASVLTYDNMLEESSEMRWFTIGMPILLVTVIIIMGGYVYSLQSQIDEIQVLLSSEEEDFFDDEQSNGAVLLNESTLAHVHARIDNLADSIEAMGKRTLDRTGDPSGVAERDGMNHVNKDLAILAERVKDLEDKGSARPLVLQNVSKAQTGGTAKPKISTPKTGKAVKANKANKANKTDKTVSGVALKPPAMRNKSGVWSVNLMSVTEKVDAERQIKGFRDKGVAAVIQPKTISGKQWYRIQVTGFGSKQKAEDYAASVKAKLGLASAWVTR